MLRCSLRMTLKANDNLKKLRLEITLQTFSVRVTRSSTKRTRYFCFNILNRQVIQFELQRSFSCMPSGVVEQCCSFLQRRCQVEFFYNVAYAIKCFLELSSIVSCSLSMSNMLQGQVICDENLYGK